MESKEATYEKPPEQHVNGADLSELGVTAIAEYVMEVRNLAGDVMRHADGRAFTITLMSRDSDEYNDVLRRQQDKRIMQAQRTRQLINAALSEADTVELLVACTKRWDIVLDGKVPASTREEYRRAYTRLRPLRDQVDEAVGVRTNFTRTASTS